MKKQKENVENVEENVENVEKKKGRGKRYSKEEFSQLPEEQQKEILKKREERETALKAVAKKDIDSILSESTSEREYNAKFNKVYKFVRESLVILRAKKVTKNLTGQALYEQTIEILNRAQEL